MFIGIYKGMTTLPNIQRLSLAVFFSIFRIFLFLYIKLYERVGTLNNPSQRFSLSNILP